MGYHRIIFLLVLLGIVACENKPDKILLVPLGKVDSSQLQLIASEVETRFDAIVQIGNAIPLPPETYYPPRNRYRADKLISFLKSTYPDYDRVMGITAKDISTSKGDHEDWGIMGLAYRPGRSCVISTFRIKRGIQSRAHFTDRLIKVCLHELGHTYGRDHCEEDVSCLMQDAAGKVITIDQASASFCETCKRKLSWHLRPVP